MVWAADVRPGDILEGALVTRIERRNGTATDVLRFILNRPASTEGPRVVAHSPGTLVMVERPIRVADPFAGLS